MTEISKFWTHGAGGDADYSPYDTHEFGPSFLDKLFPVYAGGFVIPLYGNNLEVVASSPEARSVTVKSGAAFFSGFFYESTGDEVLTIESNSSGNPRIDRIVIRINWSARTIRLAVLKGTAARLPEIPALTQILGDTWEESLAYVWAANGFTTLAYEDIHDERSFRITAALMQDHYITNNLLYNPEFLAWSGYNDGYATSSDSIYYSIRAAIRYKPDYWYVEGNILRSYLTTDRQVIHPGWSREDVPVDEVSRGFVVKFTTASDMSGIRQKAVIREGLTYSLKVLVFVPAGSEAAISYVQNGTGSEHGIKYIKRTGEWVTETIRFVAASGATEVTIYLLGRYAEQAVKFAHVILVPSLIPGEYREHHQVIPFDTYVGSEKGYIHDRIRFTNSTSDDIVSINKDLYVARSTTYAATLANATDPGVDRIISGLATDGSFNDKQLNGPNAYEGGQANKIPDNIRGVWLAGDVATTQPSVVAPRYTSIQLNRGVGGGDIIFAAMMDIGVTGETNNQSDFYLKLTNVAALGYDPVYSAAFPAGPNSVYPHTANMLFSIRPVALDT